MVKVLVLGATGKQGAATIKALLASGEHSVRAFVRDSSSDKAKALAAAGVELVEGGDWDKDVAALDQAFAGGIEAVFFPSIPCFTDMDAEVRGATNIIEAAKKAGVKHVVYSTVGGLERYRELPDLDSNPLFKNYWVSKAKGEELVKQAGFPYYTILRPNEFMSNFTTAASAHFQVPDLIKEGVWHTAHPADFQLSLIDEDDIGRVAAAAIAAPATFANRALTVRGQRLTVGELVAQLGEVAGKKLSVSPYPQDEVPKIAKENPVVAGQIAKMVLDEKGAVPDHFGLGFKTFKQHLEAHRDEVIELYKGAP